MNDGHMGPRKFWRQELVRLKYHNPAVSMTVERSTVQHDSATMSIHFTSENAPQTSGSATSAPNATSSTSTDKAPSNAAPTERVETIDMKFKSSNEILKEFMQVTRAMPVEATAEEREVMRSLEEQRIRGERDSKLSLEVRQKKKREEAILAQAKGEVAVAAQ
ncbi:hypothetical protein LTR66_007370 [Elasticomyces elasticus]|nr:hypothetical protein LTR66_007370 [Elasticomyces elasticus]